MSNCYLDCRDPSISAMYLKAKKHKDAIPRIEITIDSNSNRQHAVETIHNFVVTWPNPTTNDKPSIQFRSEEDKLAFLLKWG